VRDLGSTYAAGHGLKRAQNCSNDALYGLSMIRSIVKRETAREPSIRSLNPYRFICISD
jgi:hypothetical protein